MKLGIIIPFYQFETQVDSTLEKLNSWKSSYSGDVLLCLVDDGSSDKTFEKLSNFSQKNSDWVLALQAKRNMGKGHSIRMGFAALADRVEKILFTDCDLHYGTKIFDRFIHELNLHEIVIADRSWTASHTHQAISRRTSSYVFNRLTGLLTGVIFRDSQAGMKGFKAKECKKLFELSVINGFAFDVEILSIALSYRYKIKQVPVKFANNDELPQTSSIKLFRDSIKMILELVKINFNSRSNKYANQNLEARVDKEVFFIQNE